MSKAKPSSTKKSQNSAKVNKKSNTKAKVENKSTNTGDKINSDLVEKLGFNPVSLKNDEFPKEYQEEINSIVDKANEVMKGIDKSMENDEYSNLGKQGLKLKKSDAKIKDVHIRMNEFHNIRTKEHISERINRIGTIKSDIDKYDNLDSKYSAEKEKVENQMDEKKSKLDDEMKSDNPKHTEDVYNNKVKILEAETQNKKTSLDIKRTDDENKIISSILKSKESANKYQKYANGSRKNVMTRAGKILSYGEKRRVIISQHKMGI